MSKKDIVIGCDNAAVAMKNTIREYVRSLGYNVEDVGCFSAEDDTYYPLVAKRACDIIKESGYKKEGILICGTGMGMAMTANKCPGIRASVCHDNFSAERAKLSNDANVLCLGERVVGMELAKKVTKEWLSLAFIDGSSTPKVEAMMKIEKENFK
ncbi:MAG TPA: ribose 5-phosphate isomerase B [Clostridiales bacterium]|nr:ribose 5-phosphate isomerase B [Clostridiales bacterium]